MRVSAFKVRFLTVTKDIQTTGEPVMVTNCGTPVVKVVPVETEKSDLFGFMAEEFKVTGDIESPVVPLKQRKVFKK